MTRYARIFTGLLLLTASVMLILNQEEATYHLVEYDLFGWQISRLLVFFLPGIQLVVAITFMLKLGWMRYLKWGYQLILAGHFFDGLIYIARSGAEYHYSENLLIDPVSGFGVILTGLLIILDITLLFDVSKTGYRNLPWYAYLLALPLLGCGILKSRIYVTDFRGSETPVTEEFDPMDLKTLVKTDKGHFAVVFFDATCEQCFEAASTLAVMNPVEKIPIHAVFYSDSSAVLSFLKKSKLDISWHIVSYPEFSLFAQYAVPNAYLIKNNELQTHRTGYFINYNFFDKLRD